MSSRLLKDWIRKDMLFICSAFVADPDMQQSFLARNGSVTRCRPVTPARVAEPGRADRPGASILDLLRLVFAVECQPCLKNL